MTMGICRIVGAMMLVGVGCSSNGCGDGGHDGGHGGDDGGGIATIPVGAYTGTGALTGVDVIDGASVPFSSAPTITGIVTADGHYLFLSDQLGSPTVISQLDFGTGTADGAFTAANNLELGLFPDFNSNDLPPLGRDTNGMLTATAPNASTLDGTITYASPNGDSLTLSLALVAGSTAPPTAALPSTLTGTFTANINSGEPIQSAATAMLAIATDGTITGTVACPLKSANPPPDPTPCTVAGTLTARTDVAAYDATLTFTNGDGNSFPGWVGTTATGLAYLDAAGTLRIGTVGGVMAFAFTN